MLAFRVLVGVYLAALVVYTGVVLYEHSLTLLFPKFFHHIMHMTWHGQFNLDLAGFILLSTFWTLWRNDFTLRGMLLAVPAFCLGGIFLAGYLLYLSWQHEGKAAVMLLGETRGK